MGGTVGVGGGGLAATWFGAADIWLGPGFGLGAEGVRGSGAEVRIFDRSDSGKMTAGRLRVSLRSLKVNKTELSATLALGAASWKSDDYYEAPCVDDPPACDSLFGQTASRTQSGIDASVAAEFGARTRLGPLEFGAVVRIDLAPDVVFLTVGPTLGAAF